MIDILRKKIAQEEFDYQTLLDCLEGYVSPRDKISNLLKKGIIIRVKKGLYIFGEAYRRKPFSREILANLIYGPSYISLEYALQYHSLIPERVEAVTSVTTGRSRRFASPIGLFIYRKIPLAAFQIGMDRIEIGDGRAFLIATPEKALADKIYIDRGPKIRTQKMMSAYLENDLRVDSTDLVKMDTETLDIIAKRYRSNRILLLSNHIRHLKKRF
jgi:predicted transcriptional regulator of viral defense system